MTLGVAGMDYYNGRWERREWCIPIQERSYLFLGFLEDKSFAIKTIVNGKRVLHLFKKIKGRFTLIWRFESDLLEQVSRCFGDCENFWIFFRDGNIVLQARYRDVTPVTSICVGSLPTCASTWWLRSPTTKGFQGAFWFCGLSDGSMHLLDLNFHLLKKAKMNPPPGALYCWYWLEPDYVVATDLIHKTIFFHYFEDGVTETKPRGFESDLDANCLTPWIQHVSKTSPLTGLPFQTTHRSLAECLFWDGIRRGDLVFYEKLFSENVHEIDQRGEERELWKIPGLLASTHSTENGTWYANFSEYESGGGLSMNLLVGRVRPKMHAKLHKLAGKSVFENFLANLPDDEMRREVLAHAANLFEKIIIN